MPSNKHLVPIPGSERRVLAGARAVGTPHPKERIEVTLYVRPRPGITTMKSMLAAERLGTLMPRERQHMTREELTAAFGADPRELAKVEDFAQGHGLTVIEVSSAKRSVVLAGTVAAFCDAFGVSLATYEYWGGTYRGRVGAVHVPAELAEIVQGVLGLDNRPQAKPHFRLLKEVATDALSASRDSSPQANTPAFTPIQLAQLYNFPPGVNGHGQCVAIIELGGGYHTRDLTAYFAQLGVPTPSVQAITVDGAHNHPTGNPSGPDGEVMLDIEVAGALAPGAHFVVYFAPNTDRGFLDAIKAAIHDNQNRPSVISISWGGPEPSWTAQALQIYDQAFQEAAALGITICCAGGDDGSSDGISDGYAHVDFPASSPHVLGCGGTRLEASITGISRELVWNAGTMAGATGGGISEFFALPAFQNHANVPPSVNPGGKQGRGVPDVAGDADPATGYMIRVDQRQVILGGTSAVAPLWAALIALINQQVGHPVGYLNPLLYSEQIANSSALHDITTGNNGAYQARRGWDPCTGLGTPDGAKLLQLLTGHAGVTIS
jgi:kumamolisin